MALKSIPKPQSKIKPDWSSPEIVYKFANYYESLRAIGRLFRKIELPAVDIATRTEREQQRRVERAEAQDLANLMSSMRLKPSRLTRTLRHEVSQYISPQRVEDDREMIQDAADSFARYSSDLQIACASLTLSRRLDATLTEEEATIGTIVAKTSQPRQRMNMMSRLRENTDAFVTSVREELLGESDDPTEALRRSWAAWQVSAAEKDAFGAKSFGWIALGTIFEAIKSYKATLEQ